MDTVRPITIEQTAVTVRTFPAHDSAFNAAVVAALRSCRRVRHLHPVPARVEDGLRDAYPEVRAILRDDLGATDESPMLYVFRDGSALRRSTSHQAEGD